MWIDGIESAQSDRWIADAYAAHGSELIRYAERRLRGRDDAEDIVHEAFLRLAEEAREGRQPDQPRAWLYRVVHNIIVSRARRSAVERRHAAADRIETVEEDSALGRVIATEEWLSVNRAMACVGPAAQAGLRLAATGYSGREIASRLGKSEVAVRAMLSRARADIRTELLAAAPAA
jgi:RNA polymerase sigma-70 factor (ECF subfamily)